MPTGKRPKATRDRTDRDRLRSLSEDEIERAAAEDADNPGTLDEQEWADAFVGLPSAAARGDDRPPAKRAVHANFDSDVVAFFKRGGRGYQDRMNAVLRRHMETQLGKNAKS